MFVANWRQRANHSRRDRMSMVVNDIQASCSVFAFFSHSKKSLRISLWIAVAQQISTRTKFSPVFSHRLSIFLGMQTAKAVHENEDDGEGRWKICWRPIDAHLEECSGDGRRFLFEFVKNRNFLSFDIKNFFIQWLRNLVQSFFFNEFSWSNGRLEVATAFDAIKFLIKLAASPHDLCWWLPTTHIPLPYQELLPVFTFFFSPFDRKTFRLLAVLLRSDVQQRPSHHSTIADHFGSFAATYVHEGSRFVSVESRSQEVDWRVMRKCEMRFQLIPWNDKYLFDLNFP